MLSAGMRLVCCRSDTCGEATTGRISLAEAPACKHLGVDGPPINMLHNVRTGRQVAGSTSMMRPLGKPPPSAISSVRAPQEMCSLQTVPILSNAAKPHAAREGHSFHDPATCPNAEQGFANQLLCKTGTYTTLSGSAPICMRLPLPNRAFTSFMTFSSAFACNK